MPKLPAKKTTTPAAPKAADKPKVPGVVERKILYPKIMAQICLGEDAVTFEQAKVLIGWQVVTKDDNWVAQDVDGNYIRLNNNIRNRDFRKSDAKKWQSEHLKRHWEVTNETLGIGVTGIVTDGQHRIFGFINSVLEWRKNPEKWDKWKTEPVFECILIYGCNESDRAINTINTGRPRTLADVIYRSDIFLSLKDGPRAACSRIADHCIRLLWNRTGAKLDAFSPDRTHADSLDFLSRHERILLCVKHVYEEDGTKGNISSHYLSAGYAAALCYLFGCSDTDPQNYRDSKPASEEQLTWKNWDKAQEFIVKLAQGHKSLAALREVLGAIMSTEDDSLSVRLTVLIKAWLIYVTGKPVTDMLIAPEFHTNDESVRELINEPTCGGIDLGNPKEAPESEPPTEKEIAERAATERNIRTDKKNAHKWKVGDACYVQEDGGSWKGKVIEVYSTPGGMVAKVENAKKKSWEYPFSALSEKNPEVAA